MQVRGRLYTVGCSYTKYQWPTYADFLGTYFEKYYNYGVPGAGNDYIFTTFCRLLDNVEFQQDDCIIVQFTSLPRYDNINNGLWDNQWGNRYSSTKELGLEWVKSHVPLELNSVKLFSYVESVRRILETLPCKSTMLWMLNPTISDFFGEPNTSRWSGECDAIELRNTHKALHKFHKTFDNGFLDKGIAAHSLNFTEILYTNGLVDNHPSCDVHISYAEKVKNAVLNIEEKFNEDLYELANKWTKFKKDPDNKDPETAGLYYPSSYINKNTDIEYGVI